MPKVLCTLPNASEEIGGIKFSKHAKGMLSEDISDEQATRLVSIPGYEIVGGKAPDSGDDADAAAKDAERAELVAKAEALGVKVKGNWSLERLKSEVETAEAKAKADADAAAAEAAKKADASKPEGEKAE